MVLSKPHESASRPSLEKPIRRTPAVWPVNCRISPTNAGFWGTSTGFGSRGVFSGLGSGTTLLTNGGVTRADGGGDSVRLAMVAGGVDFALNTATSAVVLRASEAPRATIRSAI